MSSPLVVHFSTVNRRAAVEHGGELVKLDWSRKRVLAQTKIVPRDPDLVDPNPRGNTRGGRGIVRIGDRVICASYHSLLFFGPNLELERKVSNGLFASLHEIALSPRDTLLVSSTAIDAALEVALDDGRTLRSWFPREMAGFQREYGLTPLEIDKLGDNRARFLGNDHFQHPHHVHLNAVAFRPANGHALALFSKQGAIVDLDEERVLVADPALKGAHNLIAGDDDLAWCAQTVGGGILVFDLAAGKRVSRIGYASHPLVKRLVRWPELRLSLHRSLERLGLATHAASRPLFARGLARSQGRIFAGVSPATILEFDADSGELRDSFNWSRDVDACVHGLEVSPAAP